MDDNTVFGILEGTCPTCGSELKLTQVNGIQTFVDQFSPTDKKVSSKVWDKGVTEQGEMVFHCPKGHEHTVFLTFGGDWTC